MREYEGEPIDLTTQHLSEVEVSSDESYDGEVETEVGGKTELQKQIQRYKMMNPNASCRKIADELGCAHTYVYEVLKGDSSEPYSRYKKNTWDEFTDKEKKIIKLYKSDIYDSKKEIGNVLGVSTAYVTKITKANDYLFE